MILSHIPPHKHSSACQCLPPKLEPPPVGFSHLTPASPALAHFTGFRRCPFFNAWPGFRTAAFRCYGLDSKNDKVVLVVPLNGECDSQAKAAGRRKRDSTSGKCSLSLVHWKHPGNAFLPRSQLCSINFNS